MKAVVGGIGINFLRRLGAFALIFASVQAISASGPPNDHFLQAAEISCSQDFPTNVTFSGTAVGATTEPWEALNSDLVGNHERGTVWWKWTCTNRGSVEISFATRYGDLAAAAFSGRSASSLTTVSGVLSDSFYYALVFSEAGPSESIFEGGACVFAAAPGTTYWFAVMPKAGSTTPAGSISGLLAFTPALGAPPPPNDNFAARTILIGTNLSTQIYLDNATSETQEPNGRESVTAWYEWTSPLRGVAYLATTTQGSPAYLAYFQGSALTNLNPLGVAPDGGLPVDPGMRVLIQVSIRIGWPPPPGRINLSLRFEPPEPGSPNDTFANALGVDLPTYHFSGSIFGATREIGEPSALDPQTLWWRLRATDDGYLTVWAKNSQFVPRISVYHGGSLGSITGLLPAGPKSRSTFRVMRDHDYAIRVSGTDTRGGRFTLLSRFRSSTNDSFAGSLRLSGADASAYGNTVQATLEPGEPLSPESEATNTIWFSWEAPASGRAWPSPTGIWWRPMEVYSGHRMDRLVPVNLTYKYFLAIEGVVYHFHYAGDDGEFEFSIHLEPFSEPTNDDVVNAIPIEGTGGPSRSQLVGASIETGEPMHPGGNAGKASVWWKWLAPRHGTYWFSTYYSLATNVTLAVYRGSRLETLNLVGVGNNTDPEARWTSVGFTAVGGETYHIAAVVPADTVGDVEVTWYGGDGTERIPFIPVPGNLLGNPSWESPTNKPGEPKWQTSAPIGRNDNLPGGADGVSWIEVDPRTRFWQDIPTIPGHDYRIRFAYLGYFASTSRVEVLWANSRVGIATSPTNKVVWSWATFIAHATSQVTRVMFSNTSDSRTHMDAFSVVDISAPPSLVRQPTSASTMLGGTAAFFSGAAGGEPLGFQWWHDGVRIPGAQQPILTLSPVSVTDSGDYVVVVTNNFGSVTSQVATLVVESPAEATILVQPYGDVVPAGGYFGFSVVAGGTPPYQYQWLKDGEPISGATNRTQIISAAREVDAGWYAVVVRNPGGSVLSASAQLTVTNAIIGGGLINFRNELLMPWTPLSDAPIFDIDGITPLRDSVFAAQLVAGPTVESMRPVGNPSLFDRGYRAGIFRSQLISLPNVPPGGNVFAEVRVWEQQHGAGYEEARAQGRRFGRSGVYQLIAGDFISPSAITNLQSFNLQVGLPRFNVGSIDFVERTDAGELIWRLTGESGFRYSIEKGDVADRRYWKPFLTVTNGSGSVYFRDNPSDATAIYRSRLLD